ncbi:MAG: hypothetical protein QF579_00085 [Dehalococcoidia bacterium]|nr:hypothetical protein [Dehalococcoidia bacterium]
MTIRTLRTTDLLRFLIDGRNLGPDLAQTWDKVGNNTGSVPSMTSKASGLVLHQERERSSVLAEGLHLRALASVRARSGPTAWEVHCLNLPPETEEEGTELLEKLSILVGDEGGERVFLRLPMLSPITKLAKEAGFLFCTQETLYRREASSSPVPATAKFIRPFLPPDEYPIFRLYNECVPSKVKSEYALTFDEWNDAMESCGNEVQQGIYEAQSCVRGWVRVGYGKRSANRLEIMVHPEEESGVWDDLISWGLQQGRLVTPFLSLVPDHQHTLAWMLEKKGFIPTDEYYLMVKPITVRVKDSALAPVGA